MTRLRRMLVWISGASAGLGAALAATMPFDDVELIDLSRRGGTPGAHHVAVDLADPNSWPVVEADFNRRMDDFDGDMVVFIHNAGTLTPLGPAGRVDTIDTDMQAQLRACADDLFPEAHRFRELDALGLLAKPEDVARTIWSLLYREIPNGSVLHIRDII